MNRLRNWFSYANVTATAALFLAMSGVAAAVTLAPTNSVTSRSIKDGEVSAADVHAAAVTRSRLAPNAVNGAKVADGTLTGADVRNRSLAGSDIQDDSISGQDIRESSLGQVPEALVGGVGRTGDSGSCNPEDASYVTCGTVTIQLPHSARLLVMGYVKGTISQGASYGYGSCRITTDPYGLVEAQAAGLDLTGDSWSQNAPVTAVTLDSFNPGDVTVRVECNEQSGKIEYPDARITVVALSTY